MPGCHRTPTVPQADPPRAGCRPPLPHWLSRQANPPCFPTPRCPYTRAGNVRIRSAAWGRHECVPKPCVAERARGGCIAAARHGRNAKLATPCLLGESCGRRPKGRSLRPVAVYAPVRPWFFCSRSFGPKGALRPYSHVRAAAYRRLRHIPFMKSRSSSAENKSPHSQHRPEGNWLGRGVSAARQAGGTARSGAGVSTPGCVPRQRPVRLPPRCCRCARG